MYVSNTSTSLLGKNIKYFIVNLLLTAEMNEVLKLALRLDSNIESKSLNNIVRIEFSPLVLTNVSNGHYYTLETINMTSSW